LLFYAFGKDKTRTVAGLVTNSAPPEGLRFTGF
jgi:hypothetical protein